MEGLRTPERIHLVPLGYEFDRVVDPLVEAQADQVIFLELNPNDPDVVVPPYHEELKQIITDEGIQWREEYCDIFDLYDSLGTIGQLSSEFGDAGHTVYVNLSSGSKVTAIGGMIACMATGGTPYYVRAKDYAGGEINPVSSGTKSAEELPNYPIDKPEKQHIAILDYINRHERASKQELIDFGIESDLKFAARYETDGVDNPLRGYYRRLNNQIINPLEENGFIRTEKYSTKVYVYITESGENQLKGFNYLINSQEP